MRKSLMISVAAAALLAATGFANAQGTSQGGAKGGESAPAAASPRGEGAGLSGGSTMSKEPTSKESAAPEMKNGDAPKSGSMAQEQDKSGGQEKGGGKAMPQRAAEKSGAATDTKSGTKAMPQQAQEKSDTAKDVKTQGAMNNDRMNNESSTKASQSGTASGGSRPATADSKTGTDAKATTTTGNAATSAAAAPPAEKRTEIVSAIKQEKVEEVTNVNFNIAVGVAVPSSVHYYPLPSRIVEIYPEWRGYDFIYVHGRYIILRPETHEIVYIIES
jgi:hypothetical protein